MKKQIVERLLKEGHINFDEALELMDKQEAQQVTVTPITWTAPDWTVIPYQPYTPIAPCPVWYGQQQVTC